MKWNEKRYALERAKEIFNLKKEELRRKHSGKAAKVTDKQKLEAILDYDVPLLKSSTLKTTLDKAFDFRRLKSEYTFDQQAYQKDFQALNERYGKLRDAIVLADEKTALFMLESFSIVDERTQV